MKRTAILLTTALLLGCKTPRTVVPGAVKTVERKVTTLVPVFIPGDSALLRMVFECDSLNNVLLKSFKENKGGRVGSDLQFNDGVLDYKVEYKPDTVYLPSDTIFTEREVPVIVETVKEEYRMTKFQTAFFYTGLITAVFTAAWLGFKLKSGNLLKIIFKLFKQ